MLPRSFFCGPLFGGLFCWRGPFVFWPPPCRAKLKRRPRKLTSKIYRSRINNADAGLIVRSDDQLSPDQRECILASLRERKRSAGTADRALLLWGTTEVI